MERPLFTVFIEWNRMRTVSLGLAIGVGLLTIGGLLISSQSLGMGMPSQFNLFRAILSAYTPLLTPISSAAGLSQIGGESSKGILPLIIWLLTSCALGAVLRDPGRSGKAMLASASAIFLLWISSIFFSAPTWPTQSSWLMEVDKLTSDLISRPIDIASILMLPPILAAFTAYMLREGRPIKIEEDYQYL